MPMNAKAVRYTVRNLQPFTDYIFSIVAVTGGGEGAPTSARKRTCQGFPLQTSLGLKSTRQSDTSVDLVWNPLSERDTKGYVVKYSFKLQSGSGPEISGEVVSDPDSTPGQCPLASEGQPSIATTKTISGLVPATQYQISMEACTIVRCTSMTDRIPVTTQEGQPHKPLNPAAVATETDVTLTWEEPSITNGRVKEYKVLFSNKTFTTEKIVNAIVAKRAVFSNLHHIWSMAGSCQSCGCDNTGTSGVTCDSRGACSCRIGYKGTSHTQMGLPPFKEYQGKVWACMNPGCDQFSQIQVTTDEENADQSPGARQQVGEDSKKRKKK